MCMHHCSVFIMAVWYIALAQVLPSRLNECLRQFLASYVNGEHSNGCFQSRYVRASSVWYKEVL